MNKLFLIVFVASAFLLVACSGQPAVSDDSASAAPNVLATTTILADVTRNVAGERLAVESLLPFGIDPHSYQPVPQDATKISQSKVLVLNGADYETFLDALIASADGERTLIDASSGLDHRTDTDSEHSVDPHLWLDPNNMIVYTENIRDGLTQFDPQGAETYRSNADAYIAQLQELDAWIDKQVTQIEPAHRVLVTNHEAFGYFAERYDFTIVGAIIPSFSSNASPSARQMAALIEQIRTHDAPAVFLDASDSPSLAQQIAAETGVQVVTDLHLESLTDGAPAATYVDMMKYNVTRIVNALRAK